MNSSIYEYIAGIVSPENVVLKEPMSRHTTFRVGGNAECFIKVSSEEQLRKLLGLLGRAEQEFFVLGNGSNLLVSDSGYEGVILQIKDQMSAITVEDTRIYAEAGALMSQIAKAAYENELTGFEFAGGIPGTIGGGTVMNAGAYGGELKDVVESVTVMNREGELMVINCESMEFGYRTSIIKSRPFIVMSVVIDLKRGCREEIKARMDELADKRREKQPLSLPSAGSTFKRPEGHFAGQLIMEAGLRGYQIGGARVSDKHCGFVVNAGDAEAADIHLLIQDVRRIVKEKTGVTLEPEVICLGDFNT